MVEKQILVMGDVHGEWARITHQIKLKDITDAFIIQVGDFGLGLNGPNETEKFKKLNNSLKKRNIHLLVIRGNHDDPSKFTFKEYSNIVIIPDWTTSVINGLTFLFIGGAVSIDRMERIEDDEKTGDTTWFENEPISMLDESKSYVDFNSIDYLITHTAPNNFVQILNGSGIVPLNPILKRMSEYGDENLLKNCTDEQIYLEDVLNRCKNLSGVFCGHFHKSYTETIGNVKYSLLDAHEIKPLRY